MSLVEKPISEKTSKILNSIGRIIRTAVAAICIGLLAAWAGFVIYHGFLGYPYRSTAVQASPQNHAQTIFSAAQTYVVDYYQENNGAILHTVSCADLYNAKLLTRMPDTDNINIVLEERIPAVKYVEYDGVRYPEEFQ